MREIRLECSLLVHRRCRSKVGDYCGYREEALETYEQWKEKVRTERGLHSCEICS